MEHTAARMTERSMNFYVVRRRAAARPRVSTAAAIILEGFCDVVFSWISLFGRKTKPPPNRAKLGMMMMTC